MLKIRNEGLYKNKYGTFEKYLKERWGFSRIRGHQLMKSAEFMQIAAKIIPKNVNKKGEFVNIPEVILPKKRGAMSSIIGEIET